VTVSQQVMAVPHDATGAGCLAFEPLNDSGDTSKHLDLEPRLSVLVPYSYDRPQAADHPVEVAFMLVCARVGSAGISCRLAIAYTPHARSNALFPASILHRLRFIVSSDLRPAGPSAPHRPCT
jgi:hypothetical protein